LLGGKVKGARGEWNSKKESSAEGGLKLPSREKREGGEKGRAGLRGMPDGSRDWGGSERERESSCESGCKTTELGAKKTTKN